MAQRESSQDYGTGFGVIPARAVDASRPPEQGYGGAGGFFSSLINDAVHKENLQRMQWESDKDAEINMYRGIALAQPGTVTPEQRIKAAKMIDKLRNLKPGVWEPVANHLNAIEQHHIQAGAQQPEGAGGAAPATTSQPAAPAPQTTAPAPPVDPIKQGFAEKALHKIGQGLDTGLDALKSLATGPHYPALPPIDASLFSGVSPTQQFQESVDAKAQAYRHLVDDLHIDPTTAEGMLGIKIPSPERDYLRKGDPLKASNLPPDAMGPDGLVTDASGKLTGYGAKLGADHMWYPYVSTVTGRPRLYMPFDPKLSITTAGNLIRGYNPYDLKMPPASPGTPGQSIQGLKKDYGKTHEVQAVSSGGKPIAENLTSAPITAPQPGQSKPRSKVLPTIEPPQHRSEGGKPKRRTMSSLSGSGGGRPLPGYPASVFTVLGKSATGVNESYSAAFGDQPGVPGGLWSHLSVFKNPDDVRQLGEFFTMQDQYMKQASAVPKAGAVEYFTGVPLYLSNEKAQYLRDKYNQLSPESKAFVDAWTRAVAAAPGLRSATSSPSALAALNWINNEYPTPPHVNNYEDAVQRMRNLYNVMQEAAIDNPILKQNLSTHYDPFALPGVGKVFNSEKWKKANPHGDVEAAKAYARQQGYTVK